MSKREINLNDFRSPNVRVFAGRDRGKEVRLALKLDEEDRNGTTVSIHVPNDVFSVNSSFFLALFGRSIRELGADQFRAKYRFEGKNIQSVVQDCITEALTTNSPL